MRLRVNDTVSYLGADYRVEAMVEYQLADSVLRLARLAGPTGILYLDPGTSEMADRVLLLSEIAPLDLSAPPPATIYHHGNSYLPRLAGEAKVRVEGDAQVADHCALWRFRAAGGEFLHIEQWPDRIRMLHGPAVHVDMLEVRPLSQ